MTSGKKTVLLDGREVHHSVAPKGNKFQGKFECSFNLGQHHIMKLVAHAAPPAANNNGFVQRQFDLWLDGLSFFEFAKLYELGRQGKVGGHTQSRALAVAASQSYAPRNNEYRNYSVPQDSPTESIRSVEAYHDDYGSAAPTFAKPAQGASAPRPTSGQPAKKLPEENQSSKAPEPELIDFTQETVPTTVQVPIATGRPPSSASVYSGTNSNYQPSFTSPGASSFSFAMSPSYEAPSFPPTNSQALPYQQFQYQVTSYEILNKYNAQPSTSPAPAFMPEEQCTALVPVTPAKLTMEPINPFAPREDDHSKNDSNVDELTKAMNKLVNFDNIRDDSETKQREKLASKPATNIVKDKSGKVYSRGATPTNSWNTNASLAQIQATKGGQEARASVMKPPPQSTPYQGYAPAGPMYGAAPVGYPQYQQQAPQAPAPQVYNNYQFAH